jgi:uncharacterized membrane protein YbhN (UPF0104 family)
MQQPVSEPSPARASRARAVLVPILKAVVSLALLGALFSRVDVVRLWAVAKTASLPWLIGALSLYLAMILVSAWRWGLLLDAQGVRLPFGKLTSSFLVATFFNNFLPSNIGGDVIRVADTAAAAGSKTIAATVVLIDRGLGLLGLVLLAAVGASASLGRTNIGPVNPAMLWAGFGLATIVATPALLMPHTFTRLLQPIRILHPQWVDARLASLTAALARFRKAPAAIGTCFLGAIVVQAVLVGFYLAVAYSMHIPVTFTQLALVVPISFVVQMVPVSLNGFGVREATFGFYFTRLGLPLESALLVSFVGAALVILFSLSGGVAYLTRIRGTRVANAIS